MKEIMYDLPSALIVAILFVTMLIMVELGYRVGKRFERSSAEPDRGHVTSLQGALLGILALLLGFTFSLSLQRYDGRSEAVVHEANAIGTAYLRTALLPDGEREPAQKAIRDYAELRVVGGQIDMATHDYRKQIMEKTNAQFMMVWSHAVEVAREHPHPVTTGLYLQALNDMVDSYGLRNAALERHVPEIVLFLLYGTFLMTGVIVGFNAGLAGKRASLATYVMVALIVLLVFIIIDLDRPRRGLIAVNQQAMVEAHAMMQPTPAAVKGTAETRP